MQDKLTSPLSAHPTNLNVCMKPNRNKNTTNPDVFCANTIADQVEGSGVFLGG